MLSASCQWNRLGLLCSQLHCHKSSIHSTHFCFSIFHDQCQTSSLQCCCALASLHQLDSERLSDECSHCFSVVWVWFWDCFLEGFFSLSAPNLTPVYMLCKQSYMCAWDAFFMCTGICLYTNITVESAITAFWFPNTPTHFLLCIYPQSSHSASSIF